MDAFEEEKKSLIRAITRRLKTALKARKKLEAQYQEAVSWEEKQRQALLLQANLYQIPKGAKTLELSDWESGKKITFKFDPKIAPHDELTKRFRQCKKLRLGIEPLRAQLDRQIHWEERLQKALLDAPNLETLSALDALKSKLNIGVKKDKEEALGQEKLPYREYTSTTGTPIWVGKSAKDNDALTFSYARGSDVWLHVSGFSGSHVVIRNPDPDQETVQDAMQLAIFYSKAKDIGKVDVALTQVKFLKKYKGAKPGSVHLSKHKTLFGKLEADRLKRIKNPHPLP